MENKELYNKYFEELRGKISSLKLLEPTPIYGSFNIIFAISFYILGLFLIGKIPLIFSILYFYVLFVELGFISHDLIHNQYFKNKKINHFFSFVTGNLLIGLSESWWRKKHNVEHHTFTNSDIHDTDIRDYDEIFTKNEGKSKFFNEHKTVLFWFATMVLYFNLIYLSYKHIFENKKYLELFVSLLNIFLLPMFLFINFGFLLTLLSLILIFILVGVHLAFSFMVNHIGMEIIDGNEVKKYSWFDLQTRTSRNIKGGLIINHIFGGLNKQVEHHIFPQVSRKNIIKLSNEVKSFCKEKNINYHDVSFIQGLKEIFHTLKTGETVKIKS